MTNEQLDGAVVGFLWDKLRDDRDQKIYKHNQNKKRPFTTPSVVAEALGVSQQRAAASLMRLGEVGIAVSRVAYDHKHHRRIAVWELGERNLIHFLLRERKRWEIYRKEKINEVTGA